ncbi:competence/damage-inducible protein A [Agaribacter marinus]|uniref:Putative competence-damage inducible protein n=1 Tax=Virgibacillus salarius TaxID=447199 RepID=A0A941DSP5_9BACI|nr:competence/damage-inducible protein A [Virgibacillus salarius]MBR7794797.1 competence/damage-inducible protein A [Virgibacillus salarius]NAZ07517.1 competence/damage-inducible protein A [Agaribacter marinus]
MTKKVKAEIIAVGTELLLGQIANTNAQWLSQQLAQYGVNIYNHVVVGDNLRRVEETFRQAHLRSDIILVTGGLGPTEDDLTREAFQALSNLSMVEHKPSMDKIQAYFHKQDVEMTPNNRKQARVFETADVWKNSVGMAPGMMVTFEGRKWIFLPGVPREMKSLAIEHVFPTIQQMVSQHEIIKSVVLKFIGIGESKLEHELRDMIQAQTNPTIAPLAQDDGIVIRLTANGESEQQVDELLDKTKSKILNLVGHYFYGVNQATLEGEIVELLRKDSKQLATAESLTGGLFSGKLSSVPGVSDVFRGGIVSYNNEVKQNVLGVPPQVIEEYGAISKECALAMAKNAATKLNASIGIGFTGVAGPSETEGKPVGTVYIAIYDQAGHTIREKCQFQGDRNTIRRRTVQKGLELLYNHLK